MRILYSAVFAICAVYIYTLTAQPAFIVFPTTIGINYKSAAPGINVVYQKLYKKAARLC